jgi:polysaccharide export outer membrane protein
MESKMFRWLRIVITVGALMTIASEAVTAEFGNPASGNAPYLWSGSMEQGASNQFAPSVNSKEKASNSQPSQQTERVGDRRVARAADTLTAEATPGAEEYKIGPLDVLDISVFQAPDLSKTVEVASNGTIDIPLLGETPAAGKSTYQLQRELNSKYGAKYLQNPQVTVVVKQFNSNRVTVSGAVNRPGVFPFKGETLLQYIAMAGGVTPEASSTVLVVRQINGARSAAKFDLTDIQTGRVADPAMQAGDMVVADTSTMKKGLNVILKVLPLAAFAGI